MPPKGVTPLSTNTAIYNVNNARKNPGSTTYPEVYPDYTTYTLKSKYQFNSLNQLVWQTTPDGGASDFYYDCLGRLVASQNAKQSSSNKFSYTKYDEQGRISEVGQLTQSGSVSMSAANAFSATQLSTWFTNCDASREQITQTNYDVVWYGAVSSRFTGSVQRNLRKRVSSIVYISSASSWTIRHGTYYSYDIHGNVFELVQENQAFPSWSPDMRYKKVEYSYDLISGRVNQVDFQIGYPDRFSHKYTYDADNRIVQVQTSSDGYIWDRDAYYQYYLHGPLMRTELGERKVQGLDYFYTLQGWIKGLNSESLFTNRDPGKDMVAGSAQSTIAPDVFGYSLGYYSGDYQMVSNGSVSTTNKALGTQTNLYGNINNLYNGNICFSVTAIKQFMSGSSSPAVGLYTYDQLNRLTDATYSFQLFTSTNIWGSGSSLATTTAYKNSYTYDANGNILTLLRNGNSTTTAMDNLTYNYVSNTNKLAYVDDAVSSSNYTTDIDDQSAGNYDYDAIGNLIKDVGSGITNIDWYVNGKIKQVSKTGGITIDFEYDATGNRAVKKVTTTTGGSTTVTTTYYSRDAQGNVMGVYTETLTSSTDVLKWTESPIYGSSRLGSYKPDKIMNTSSSGQATITRGYRYYELSNHLGNVCVVINDKKTPTCVAGNPVSWTAEVMEANDYYPFGQVMPSRTYALTGAKKTRFGFNGKEKDAEVGGDDYDFGARMYDARVGRWMSVDPLMAKFPDYSPYNYVANSPLRFADIDGKILWDPLEKKAVIYSKEKNEFTYEDGSPLTESYKKQTEKTFASLTSSNAGRTLIQKMQDHQTKIIIDETNKDLMNGSPTKRPNAIQQAKSIQKNGLYDEVTIFPDIEKMQLTSGGETGISFDEKLLGVMTIEYGHLASKDQIGFEQNNDIYGNKKDFALAYNPLMNEAIRSILEYRKEKNIAVDKSAFAMYEKFRMAKNKDDKNIGGDISLNKENKKVYDEVQAQPK